jgi:hypothetical protein
MDMDAWIDDYARALGEDPLTPAETGAMLKLARDVAHGVERRLAPLSTYLAGIHAGRVAAGGGDRADAGRDSAAAAARLMPEATDSPSSG